MTEISLHILDIVHNSIRANAKKINIFLKLLMTGKVFLLVLLNM